MTGPEEKIAKIKKEIEGIETTPYEEIAYLRDKYDLKKKQDKLLEMLLVIDDICRKNGIKYSIAYGTNLGAYRYGEFIPWDDDADVMMTRAEFDKFREAIKDSDDYKVIKVLFTDRFVTKESLEDYRFIDIFVFDEAPKSEAKYLYRKFIAKLYRLPFFNIETMKKKCSKKKGIKVFLFTCVYLVCILVGKTVYLFHKNNLIESYEKMLYRKCEKSDKYMLSLTGTWDDASRVYMKKWFDNYTEIELCGHSFMCIKDMEEFFINRYGNYKSIPPIETCKPVHEIGIAERKPWQVRLDWK